jgi:serine/threonine-protein kinase RsbW
MAQRIQVTRVDGRRAPEVASVLLTVPAHQDYIVIVRSAVAQLAACFGFTLGEIGDLRLAVDETCNLLVAGTRPDLAARGLECQAGVRGDVLHVTVAAPAVAADPPDTEGFGWAILNALVDALEWERDHDVVRVHVAKRAASGPAERTLP